MNITMKQMAQAYLDNLHEEIKRGEESLDKQKKYVTQLKNHLAECLDTINNTGDVVAKPVNQTNTDGTATTTVGVNPFLNLG